MEVILTQNLEKLGKTGDVIRVKDGFARNFLLPRGMALLATPVNLRKVKLESEKIAQLRQREKEKAQALSERLNGMSVTIPVAIHDGDKLYGSIGAIDIIDALKQEGFSELTKDMIVLSEPIKSIGVFDVTIRLHSDISTKIKVWVVKK